MGLKPFVISATDGQPQGVEYTMTTHYSSFIRYLITGGPLLEALRRKNRNALDMLAAAAAWEKRGRTPNLVREHLIQTIIGVIGGVWFIIASVWTLVTMDEHQGLLQIFLGLAIMAVPLAWKAFIHFPHLFLENIHRLARGMDMEVSAMLNLPREVLRARALEALVSVCVEVLDAEDAVVALPSEDRPYGTKESRIEDYWHEEYRDLLWCLKFLGLVPGDVRQRSFFDKAEHRRSQREQAT